MIKINLSNSRSQIDVSNVAGFDFTKLKIKAVLLVIFLIYVPDFLLLPTWEEQRQKTEEEITQRQTQLTRLKRKVSQSQDLEKQIKELKTQEENLGKKLVAVKQAISEKKNPSALLLFMVKNMPAELWITDLTIDLKQLKITGEALDYASIGNFVNTLKSSVFIKDANISKTQSVVINQRRIEQFEVTFEIARFDQ